MPVFLQGTAQTAPEQTSALQQAPVDASVKKLKDAKTNVEKYQTRVKYTSTALIVAGVVGMAVSFYKMMTAGKRADHMINGGHHPHNRTEEMGKGPKYVTHEQFELYDTLKTLSSIMFFIFAKVLAVGKCGRMMVWRNKSKATSKLGKKSCFGFVLIILMSLYAAHEGHHIKMIMHRVHPHPKPHHGRHGRHLEEELVSHAQNPFAMTQLKDDEDTCNAIGDEAGCNANDICSWCKAGAVKDACHSLENAKKLPAAVFKCSKLDAEEEKPVEEVKLVENLKDDDPDADYCWDFKNEDKCNTDEKCAWCTAGAVPPSCNSLKGAAELPPSVFKCAKVPQKEEKPVKKLSDDGDYCWNIKQSSTCNADAKCAWCDAAAVPASCNAIADAKLLPPDVFNCPKVQAKEEEKPVKDDDPDADYCWDFKNEDKCNTDEKCAWCTAGAVPPSCNSLKGAAELPPSVFKCAKVPQKHQRRFDRIFQQAEKMIENAMNDFDRISARFDRDDQVFRNPMLKNTDQDTCATFKVADQCQSSGCSWCKSAAVKPSCNNIDNAAKLPPAVFKCDPLPSPTFVEEEEEEEVEDEEEPKSLWDEWVHRMKGGRRGRNHEGRPHHGGKHHGRREHHGRHHRGEGPPPMMDEEESFYGRPPMGPRVESDREEFNGRKHHGGKHGHHGKKRLCRLFRVILHVAAVALFGGHFFFVRRLGQEQVKVEKITGKPDCGKKGWKKEKKMRAFQQPVVVEYSPVIQATESSIEEISEDKEIGIVYAPNPTGVESNRHQMI